MNSKGFVWVAITLATILTIGLTSAAADDYPKRPITLICPWGAGGGTDAVSRIIATLLKKELGVPVNVVNRTGGSGAVGHTAMATAKPDGYTLLAGGLGWSSATPAIDGRSKGPDDLISICRINYNSIMIVARGDAPYKNFKELMAWIRANPGELVVGSGSRYIQDDYFWRKMMNEKGIWGSCSRSSRPISKGSSAPWMDSR